MPTTRKPERSKRVAVLLRGALHRREMVGEDRERVACETGELEDAEAVLTGEDRSGR